MKFISKFSLLVITVIIFSCTEENEKFLEINGKVLNADSKSIILIKPHHDYRYESLVEIPIENGEFYYKSKLKNPEAVYLLYGEARKGGGSSMPLFLENEKIDLVVHAEEEFDKNIVSGGKLNAQYKEYRQNFDAKFNESTKPLYDRMRELRSNDEYESDTLKALYSELKESESRDVEKNIYGKIDELKKTNQHLSPKAKLLDAKLKLIQIEQEKFKQEYIKNNPTIVSYFFLLQDLVYFEEKLDVDLTKENYQKLSEAHPNHPYNELAFNLINAIVNIKVGGKFIDFSAPDLYGKEVKLSTQINGKIAILDLWATWCSPCIKKSRTMVPLYNEFKNKGFTVVGVAGEYKNTENLVKVLEKEKWPWPNLVELDRQNNIWQKYGADNAGGRIFLIDRDGEILAINPTAEEVRKELETRLN